MHHREAKPVARRGFIGTTASLQHTRTIGFGDSGPIVIDDQL